MNSIRLDTAIGSTAVGTPAGAPLPFDTLVAAPVVTSLMMPLHLALAPLTLPGLAADAILSLASRLGQAADQAESFPGRSWWVVAYGLCLSLWAVLFVVSSVLVLPVRAWRGLNELGVCHSQTVAPPARFSACQAAIELGRREWAQNQPARSADLESALRLYRISAPYRMKDIETLERVLQPPVIADAKPVALLIFPRADSNGAFADAEIAAYEAQGFAVVYREASTEAEAVAVAREVRAQRMAPLDLLVIGGHGQPGALQLGASDVDAERLDYFDRETLKRLAGTLAVDGQVLLLSCSTGAGGQGAVNLATAFARARPGISVFAPQSPSNSTTQVWRKNRRGVPVLQRVASGDEPWTLADCRS